MALEKIVGKKPMATAKNNSDYSVIDRYADNFKGIAESYFSSKEGTDYLKGQGLSRNDIVSKMFDSSNNRSSRNFFDKVQSVADSYGVPERLAERFILDNEAAQMKYDTIKDTVEKQRNYYKKKATEWKKKGNTLKQQEYHALASIAECYMKKKAA